MNTCGGCCGGGMMPPGFGGKMKGPMFGAMAGGCGGMMGNANFHYHLNAAKKKKPFMKPGMYPPYGRRGMMPGMMPMGRRGMMPMQPGMMPPRY